MLAHRIPPHQLASMVIAGGTLATPLYRSLAERIRLLAVDGRLPALAQLPSERDLAMAMGVSRTTISTAYTALREAQVIGARRGAGHFITAHRPDVSQLLPAGPCEDGVIGLVAACMEAMPGTSAAFTSAMAQLPRLLAGPGYSPEGLPDLRRAIAARYDARGLATDPSQIIVTTGALTALNIITRALSSAGDRAIIESPTYTNAAAAIRAQGVRLLPVPVTAEGWDIAAISSITRRARPAFAYLIPDFQNPTGAVMSDTDRSRIAHLLHQSGCLPVIDETMLDCRIDLMEMPAPMASFGEALLIGSAAKSYWGGLRIGWIRAPRRLVGALMNAWASLGMGAPPLEQLVVADLMAHESEIAPFRQELLRGRRDHLVSALRQTFSDWRCAAPPGGLALWVDLPTSSSTALVDAAAREGIVVSAGPRFYVGGGGERKLRLPFVEPPDVLDAAVARLAIAWQQLSKGGRTGRAPVAVSTRRPALLA